MNMKDLDKFIDYVAIVLLAIAVFLFIVLSSSEWLAS